MKAMILAAGVGSRLRPLTDTVPKALIEVGGATMLERVARRLIAAGVGEIIINVHHLPEPIEAFLKKKNNFGVRVELSREKELLDTGGGIKNAAWFLDGREPFLVHNVDVLSDLDLQAIWAAHQAHPALATLAVRERVTSRRLLFQGGFLCGRLDKEGAPPPGTEALAFDGVHVISPEIFPKLAETGAFSIAAAYARLAAAGEKIRAFRADRFAWRDIGSAERLGEARREAPRS